MPSNFLSDVLTYRVKIFSFMIEFDHTWFEKTLRIMVICRKKSRREKQMGPTIGAKIISSYARKPYFSVNLFGRRTMKS